MFGSRLCEREKKVKPEGRSQHAVITNANTSNGIKISTFLVKFGRWCYTCLIPFNTSLIQNCEDGFVGIFGFHVNILFLMIEIVMANVIHIIAILLVGLRHKSRNHKIMKPKFESRCFRHNKISPFYKYIILRKYKSLYMIEIITFKVCYIHYVNNESELLFQLMFYWNE